MPKLSVGAARVGVGANMAAMCVHYMTLHVRGALAQHGRRCPSAGHGTLGRPK